MIELVKTPLIAKCPACEKENELTVRTVMDKGSYQGGQFYRVPCAHCSKGEFLIVVTKQAINAHIEKEGIGP
jgi:hypothetical protein